MNYLKRIALVVLLFVVITSIISVFLPSSFHLERKTLIDADREVIFKQVNDLKKWKNWSPWALKDSAIYNNVEGYSDPSYGTGATFDWDSEHDEVGSGSLKVLEVVPNEYIENSIDFGMGETIGKWNFRDDKEGVEVIWSLDIEFGFNPLSKFFGLFMEDQIAPDYELGLSRLKLFTENLPKIKRVEVKKTRIEKDLWFLSIRDTVNQHEMNNIHGKIYAKINQYLDENQIEMKGFPLVIYHNWAETIDIEVGMPVQDSMLVDDSEIKLNKINHGNVVTATHYGAYERLPETYFGINEWMRKNKVVVIGPPWESYITDPATEPNPDKWETAIFFPIE